MRSTLWHHPWAIALAVALIGFIGELLLYTSEEGAAAMYGLAAGLIAYLACVLLLYRGKHHHSHGGHAPHGTQPPVQVVPPHL